MRAYEFDAIHEGDWAIHCHKSHHTMNAMGHDLPTFIGADKRKLTGMIRKETRGYMPMGTAGMADMGEMSMELPENTVPMMTGWGPYGPLEMGGMFSVVKVRAGIAADDYSDPGWYKTRRAPKPGIGPASFPRRPATPAPIPSSPPATMCVAVSYTHLTLPTICSV